MHVSSFAVNEHIASRLGLRNTTLSDLGPLVVLVGENGCGKTRLLEAIDWLLRRTRHVGFDRLSGLRKGRAKKKEFFDALASEPPDDHYTFAAAGDDIDAYNALLSPFEGFELAVESGETVDESLSTYCELSDILRNSLSSNREHFARLAIGVPRGDDETDPILIGTPLAYIDDVCIRQASASGYETVGFHSPNNAVAGDYDRLRKLFSDLAGMELDIASGHGSLDGRSIRNTSFSDGQMALFRIVVLLHSKVLKNAAIPILLDEPERHLHPSRLIALVDALREYLPHAQLWIATHSLALTAHLAAVEPRAIWFGADGHFERAGLTQEKVVNGLLGGPAGAEQISDFCIRADQFAACAFSADCLSPPETAVYKPNDPQVKQINDFLAFAGARRITIVDIGAGQGRLLNGLAATLAGKLTSRVSYYAIEPNPTTRAECTKQVRRYFDDGIERVFVSASDYLAAVHERADVAVLINVLHEIEVQHWASVLSDAHSLLSDEGSLLIVEDTRLPRGELAHANGFLVLESDALCELFGTHSSAQGVQCIVSSRGGTRLQATAFRKEHLAMATTQSIERALQMQMKSTAINIRDLRKSPRKPDYRLGHEHAYHTQLFANITLAIEDLQAFKPQA
ncbi:AAA family ATPase [Comamonas avium]|uniref:AAA family ATPase n=1 Tax=Comamonas avium TaxID=2762231 RepID=A0ABR8S9E3_9BURK|nr:AAA family ATPase [Comamonas avium]MBD7960101.1 AAA family ATPase [Comamonas avium]